MRTKRGSPEAHQPHRDAARSTQSAVPARTEPEPRTPPPASTHQESHETPASTRSAAPHQTRDPPQNPAEASALATTLPNWPKPSQQSRHSAPKPHGRASQPTNFPSPQ